MKFLISLALLFSTQAFAAEESTSRMPAEESTPSRAWAMAGLGTYYMRIDQSIPGVVTLNTNTAGSFSQHVNAGFMTSKNWGAQATYFSIPTQSVAFSDQSSDFKYSHVSAEVTGLMPRSPRLSFGMRAGLSRRAFSLFGPDANFNIASNDVSVVAATAGGLMEIRSGSGRWRHQFNIGYEFPMFTRGYDLNQKFGAMLGAGSSMDFGGRFTMGLFAAMKWLQGDYKLEEGAITTQGYQSLFATTFDYRLGMHF